MKVFLGLPLSTLPNVEVMGPPIWKRGDTTFFRAQAYQASDDKKLIDLIRKMPGFEFTDQGKLLFEKKPVDKILVQGEELFADKIHLLLNNFPVHVLDQVQALENQTSNPMLKGLKNEQLTYLNLKINNDDPNAAFGNGEAAVGTRDRYAINPVLFGLYKKVKVGVILNFNSLGTGFDWKVEAELHQPKRQRPDRWMMSPFQPTVVNNVESRHYIRNKLFDNRVQVNWGARNKVKITSELSYVNDIQRQQTTLRSDLLDGNQFFSRNDRTSLANKPHIGVIQNQLEHQFDSSRMIKCKVNMYGNFGSSQQSTVFEYNPSSVDSSIQYLKNNWLGWQAELDFVVRKNLRNASKFWIAATGSSNAQRGSVSSRSIAAIFNLQEAYNQQITSISNKNTSIQGGIELYTKPRHITLTYGVKFHYTQDALSNTSTVNGANDSVSPVIISPLFRQETYGLSKVMVYLHRNVLVGNWSLNLRADLGMQFNHHLAKSNTIPKQGVGSVAFDCKRTFAKRAKYYIHGNVHLQPRDLNQMVNGLYPVTLQNYRAFVNGNIPALNSELVSGLSYQTGRISHAVLMAYSTEWNGMASENRFVEFFQSTLDSFNRRARHNLTFSYNLNWNNYNKKKRVTYSLGINQYQMQYSQQGKVLFGRYDLAWLNFIYHKGWTNRYYIEWHLNGLLQRNVIPVEISGSSISSVGHLRSSFKSGLGISKDLMFIFHGSWFLNNLGSPSPAQITLLNAELSWQQEEKPFSFRIRFENLTNQKSYQSFNFSQTSQTVYELPFVLRNLLLSCRVEF